MADKAKIKVTGHREYQIDASQLAVLVGRAFDVDTRGAWLELVYDDDERCDECGLGGITTGWAVRLVLPFCTRDVEVE